MSYQEPTDLTLEPRTAIPISPSKSTQQCPKISIILSVYNVEPYIAECIESILSQTMHDIEIVAVNDDSPDKSLDILEKYRAIDSRIKIINQNNAGAGMARNRGIRESSGEFIFFLDPDDFFPNNRVLEKLYANSKMFGTDLCGGGGRYYIANGRKSGFFY